MDTPQEIAKALRPMTEGKTFCDLGSRTGVFASKVKAKKKICVDLEEKDLKEVRKKGIDGVQGDIMKMELPEADVYYCYTHVYNVGEVWQNLKDGILVFGFPSKRLEENDVPDWFKNYPMKVEINTKKGLWTITIMGKKSS